MMKAVANKAPGPDGAPHRLYSHVTSMYDHKHVLWMAMPPAPSGTSSYGHHVSGIGK